MPHNLSHEELLQAYLELQSRVTQFSAKEQELINVRDLLDQELVGYKRMNDFHAAAIEVHEVSALLSLIAETTVDLFETEVGFACSIVRSDPLGFQCQLEGASRSREQALKDALREVCRSEGDSFRLVEVPDDGRDFPFARYMVGRKMRPGSDLEMVIVAAVTSERKETYNTFSHRNLTMFRLFVESCLAYLEAIMASGRINDQLETIQRSELELRRLSLIATKTHSGVIITDGKGRIEWVNEAFIRNTGYTLEEVLGRKPKEFLQTPGLNDSATLKVLSDALLNKQNISVDLKNRKKSGDFFYIRLNITPVYDLQGHLVNFIAIQQDITVQKMSEKRMIEQNEELIKINQELDQFVYSISHDLRAPLLSIQGLLGLMRIEEWEGDNREYLNLISESTRRLDQTILEILNYSRNARMDLEFAPFNLKRGIQNILSDLGSMRRDVETSLTWSGAELVHQDEVRIGVLLKNILANAIKYSKRGEGQATVQVRVAVGKEDFSITVIDNGEGIDAAHVDRVFEMFYRATRSSPGTGLGLYISKEIADKLGGQISLVSDAGKGTEVTITLPQQRNEQVSTH